jgi:hypothetical protein
VLPDKAAFALEEAVGVLTAGPDGEQASSEVVLALARRALGRRRGGGGSAPLPDDLAKTLQDRFSKTSRGPRDAIADLSAELQIARVFLDAYQEAWGDDVFQRSDA